ncbi:MAG TPA: hypothetical protein VGB98_21360 [Pyrinomonadaceae bacterium]
MKRLHKAIISFGIVAILTAGSSGAFAKSPSVKERDVSGSVVSINRTSRTLIVREQGSDRLIQVSVPKGRHVRTSQTGLSFASFDQLVPGMFLRDVRVSS